MRVLVSGAGGFLGRGLTPYLIARGHEVVAATRDVSSVSVGQPIQIDSVGPETDWSSALDGVDAVVHLAARAHVLNEEAADPLAEHRRVNTEGTSRLAQQALKMGVRRFVFMSSIGVLGNNSLNAEHGGAFTEEDQPAPHDDYSRSKWEAEQALASISGLELTVIRPPLIYGPGVPGNFRRLLGLARDGKPFPLALKNKRSLIGLDNLCSFIGLVLEDQGALGQTYVLADEEQISTSELYLTLCRHLSRTPRLINIPEPALRALLAAVGKGKMAERLCDSLVVDATKAHKQLGWQQTKTMDEGLREAAESFGREGLS